ncbi:hypothetical protein CMV24_14035 [Pseudomonas plecoglossicida]|uniref:Uncharacterized protein n=1 Tax=Pseudomonas plecoglossicida TaxID=70775 RepID=A0A2A3M5J4_PSEDL|nr:hypothetical protein CMV24_14035 [Pseudomonas plecoglossicida]
MTDGFSSDSVGAGSPANEATRYMAPASPVFAGEPAPTGEQCAQARFAQLSQVSGHPLHPSMLAS